MIETVGRTSRETDVCRIEADVAEVAGVLNAAHGRLVELAAELIETEAWRGIGIRSVEHWLCWRAGLSAYRAKQVVGVARRRAELPVTCATLARGELSLEQVGEVARFVPTHNDAEAAGLAKAATVSQLHNTLSRYRFANTTPETDQSSGPTDAADTGRGGGPDAAARRGTVGFGYDGDRFGLHADAPLDEGAVIERALLEAKDALFQAGRPGLTWMDALVEVCHRSLGTVTSEPRRSRFRIYAHLDIDGGWLTQGPALPAALLAKISCDGIIQPVWETAGSPVNVGRSQRIVPDRTRRLVLDRDRGCIVPGCGSRVHLEVHHLIAWSRGGRTDTANLACLCPFHHDALHRAELTITGDADHPDTLRFIDGLGRPMPPMVPPTVPSRLFDDSVGGSHAGTDGDDGGPDVTTEVAARHRYRHPPGERFDNRWVHFSPASWHQADASRPNAPPT